MASLYVTAMAFTLSWTWIGTVFSEDKWRRTPLKYMLLKYARQMMAYINLSI